MCVSCCSRDYHKSIRNAWNPAFFSQSLEGYASLMNSGAEGMLRRVGKAAARGQELDIWRTLGDMTMAVVGSASFGYVPCLLTACCCMCKFRLALNDSSLEIDIWRMLGNIIMAVFGSTSFG